MKDFPHINAPRAQRRKLNLQRGRRRGVTLIYVAAGMTLFLGAAALAVDMGHLYSRKAQAQRAADAAALAGAYALSVNAGQSGAITLADAKAREYAGKTENGTYVNGTSDGTTVTVTSPVNGVTSQIQVTVSRPEVLFFGRIFGLRTARVTATSTAAYELAVDIPIASGDYGKNGDSAVTYSIYGPDSVRSNGDAYSPKLLSDGTPNPSYTGNGYSFTLNVPYNYSTLNNGTTQVQVDIFDPDCHNAGGQLDSSATAVDELREDRNGVIKATTTTYQLWMDIDGNPNNPDPADHVPIAEKTYGDDANTDMKWVTPPGFKFDLNDLSGRTTASKFRVVAKTTDGSSENGFNLRAGPPPPDGLNAVSDLSNNDGTYWNSNYSEDQWHDYLGGDNPTAIPGYGTYQNGTSVGAQGNLPMNFNQDTEADINLGNVPAAAAGGKLSVTKFDTDVGPDGTVNTVKLYYTCDSLPGQTFSGSIAGNDQFATDVIPLPANYSGGNWTAHYTAGNNDTSSWKVSYDRGTGIPSGIKLVS